MECKLSVRDVMSSPPVVLPPGRQVSEAVSLMASHAIGSVIIVDNMRPVGIFTERDLIKCLAANGKNGLDMTVIECGSRNLLVLRDNNCIVEAFYLLNKFNVRHAPVVDSRGVLVGVITLKDIAYRMVEEPDLLLDLLELSVPELSKDTLYLLIRGLKK